MKRDPTVDWQNVPASSLDLRGYRAIVIGGTGGIGRAISHVLAARGAGVTVVGQTFRDAGLPGVEFVYADLSAMREAQRIAAELPAETVDLLLFTAGIMAGSQRQTTKEEIEIDMAISYLSRLVIQREIGPRLGRSVPPVPPSPASSTWGFPARVEKEHWGILTRTGPTRLGRFIPIPSPATKYSFSTARNDTRTRTSLV